jgi:hypothetical protein
MPEGWDIRNRLGVLLLRQVREFCTAQTEWDGNKPLYSCFRVNLTYGTLRDPVDAACALLFEKTTLLVVEAAGPRAA